MALSDGFPPKEISADPRENPLEDDDEDSIK